jgi:hypothetical protein
MAYEKLTQFISDSKKINGSLKYREFDQKWLIEVNGHKTAIKSIGSCYFKAIDILYKPKDKYPFPTHSEHFKNELIDNIEEEIIKRFG